MFGRIIAEARQICAKKRRKVKDLDERPEANVATELSLPRRGLEKTHPYGELGGRTTLGHSTHSQTSRS